MTSVTDPFPGFLAENMIRKRLHSNDLRQNFKNFLDFLPRNNCRVDFLHGDFNVHVELTKRLQCVSKVSGLKVSYFHSERFRDKCGAVKEKIRKDESLKSS